MEKEKFEAIETANDYIVNLIAAVKKISEDMYSGNENEGIKILPSIADGLDYICKIVGLTDNAFGKINNIEEMNEHFNEIVNALEGEDYILIGDLFTYEVMPMLEKIEGAFKEIIAEAK